MTLIKTKKTSLIKKPSKEHVRNQLDHHDPAFLDRLSPYFNLLDKYFRYEVIGLNNVPKNKKCIIVMNHGIIPYHGFLLAKQLIDSRRIYPRGLGAGFLFSIPYIRDFFLKGGAVNANHRNGRRLLKDNNCIMLSPGGIYEALLAGPGMKRIPWERRKGFVELAVETGSPIIPTYCDGINEVYFNSKFLLKKRIKILEKNRFSMPLFFGIGLLPLPQKLIHFVGKPVSVRKKQGESRTSQVNRIHKKVIQSMKEMAGINRP